MQVGIQFFPDIGPDVRSARDYWQQALSLVALCDRYGYSHVRTVEHYFHPYGGYSPNPVVFLAAAAQVTKRARLVTGAVLPAFNNPLKLAGELAMLDALCDGRLDIGFARAFLPHEFARFGVKLDESRARFDEGMEQVRLLLEQENVTCEGRFHSFRNVTSLPRPTQKPRPPFYVAALATKESFERAGAAGHGIMAIPMAGGAMAELLGLYREAWTRAGHPGRGTVMLAFHMFCHQDQADGRTHRARAAEPLSAFAGRTRRPTGWRANARPTIQATTRSSPPCRATRSRRRSRNAPRGSARRSAFSTRSKPIAGRSAISRSPRCRSTSTTWRSPMRRHRCGCSARKCCRDCRDYNGARSVNPSPRNNQITHGPPPLSSLPRKAGI